MSNRFYFVFLILSILSYFSFSQEFTSDKIIRFEAHPIDDQKFITKFYSKETLKVAEVWEMGTRVADINSNNYNELLKKHLIFPDGKCYYFYPSSKPLADVTYLNGDQRGELNGYFESGEPMLLGTIGFNTKNYIECLYQNGNTRKTQQFKERLTDWDENAYYPNGEKQYNIQYISDLPDGKYQSYFPDGSTHRKAKFEVGNLKSSKCFNETGKEIPCPEFYQEPVYPGGWDALENTLEKLDWPFNLSTQDTATLQIYLEIDILGKAELANYSFKHADSLQIMLNNWVASLYDFTPAMLDGFKQNCYLYLGIPICEGRVLRDGEVNFGRGIVSLGWNPEKKLAWYREYPSSDDDQVFFILDRMPVFPGGEEALRSYIARSINYPLEAQKKGIQGKVYVTFIVEKDGSVSNTKIAKGVDFHLNNEALRVVKSMPKWQPGMHRNKAARVYFTVPINFVLSGPAFLQPAR